MTAPIRLAVGQRLDRYVVEGELGEGASGRVYSARDTKLGRRIALKVLASGASDEEAARFLREARAVAAFDDPRIVQIFDVGESLGVAFIAMELVTGSSLRALVGTDGIPLATRVGWLADVAAALDVAHERGLVHRDLKPENVMITAEGRAKILDFGMARRGANVPASGAGLEGMATLTAEGLVLGTPGYMSPEQMWGEPLDGRTDQFAWAVVAYELLAGRPPWGAPGTAVDVHAVLAVEPTPLRAFVPELPPALEAVVSRAMAKSKEARFGSMAEVVAALAPILVPAPAIERPVAPPGDALAPPAATTEEIVPLAPRAASPRWGMALALAVAVGCAVGAVTTRRRPAGPVVPAAPSPKDAARAQPLSSRNAEAISTYRAGLQSARDAAQRAALRSFTRAAALDPSFAEAHLQYVLVAPLVTATTREHYAAAVAHRSALGPRDAALLEAFEPWIREPQDTAEWERRVGAIAQASPDNVDAQLALCRVQKLAGRDPTLAACDAALRLDPELAPALRWKALGRVNGRDVEGGRALYEECIRVSPAATSCLGDLLDLDENEGRCEESIANSRRLIALDPATTTGYVFLSEAIAGAGRPLEGAEVALNESRARLPYSEQRAARLRDEASLRILEGRFVDAAARLVDWDEALASSSDEADHLAVMRARVALALEMGDTVGAARVARDYLARRAAWTPLSFADGAIYGQGALHRAGASPTDVFARERARWLAAESARKTPSGQYGTPLGVRWIAAFAEPTASRADARAALEVLHAYEPLPGAYTRSPDSDEPIGRVHLLAGGHGDEAVAYLARAAHACYLLTFPIDETRASAELGMALEQRGDRAGACEAYAVVLRRWGKTTESSTARLAAERARALGCALAAR